MYDNTCEDSRPPSGRGRGFVNSELLLFTDSESPKSEGDKRKNRREIDHLKDPTKKKKRVDLMEL